MTTQYLPQLIPIVVVTIAVLLASAVWASRRFKGFARLPRQFGITGKVNAYWSRDMGVWFTPLFLSVTLIALVALTVFYPEGVNTPDGDPTGAIAFAGVALVGAQGFILYLMDRWAREQGG